MGFAIPINVGKKFVKDVEDGVVRERTSTTNMGMALMELDPLVIKELKMQGLLDKSVTHGLKVVLVFRESPANLAGIRRGDIITQMDGKDLTNFLDFAAAFWGGKGNMEMKIWRGDREVIISI